MEGAGGGGRLENLRVFEGEIDLIKYFPFSTLYPILIHCILRFPPHSFFFFFTHKKSLPLLSVKDRMKKIKYSSLFLHPKFKNSIPSILFPIFPSSYLPPSLFRRNHKKSNFDGIIYMSMI